MVLKSIKAPQISTGTEVSYTLPETYRGSSLARSDMTPQILSLGIERKGSVFTPSSIRW